MLLDGLFDVSNRVESEGCRAVEVISSINVLCSHDRKVGIDDDRPTEQRLLLFGIIGIVFDWYERIPVQSWRFTFSV